MTLKILFRFHESPTIWLFQIASVSHSKDDTEIPTTMVLRPIGERLMRLITAGGILIIQDDGSGSPLLLGLILMQVVTSSADKPFYISFYHWQKWSMPGVVHLRSWV
jgi:hypothetical protein